MEDAETKVLLIEDNADDAWLIRETLAEAGGAFAVTQARRLSTGLEQLIEGGFDAVLLDLSLPDSRGLETFARVHDRAPHTPILVLSGLDDRALAVRAVRQGAQDYLIKGQTDGNLLTRAIGYAIERKAAEMERERLIAELQAALAKVKTLSGLLPICASCKKIRDDRGYWTEVETYIFEHSEADFTHGLCPACAKELFPEFYEGD